MKSKPAKDCSVVLVKTKLETTKKRIIKIANAVRPEFKDNLKSPKLSKYSDHYQNMQFIIIME